MHEAQVRKLQEVVALETQEMEVLQEFVTAVSARCVCVCGGGDWKPTCIPVEGPQ